MAILTTLEHEVAARIANGSEYVSMSELSERYLALGYRFERSMDCTCVAEYVGGARVGESYPCKTLYPVQVENGKSAWNIESLRDANFKAMQLLRNQCFSVSRGFIVEV